MDLRAPKLRYESEPRELDDVAAGADDAETWLPIYRFKYATHAGLLSRLKLYVTLVALGLPAAGRLGLDVGAELGGLVALAAVASLSLVVVARVTTRLIGVISIHAREDLIRVGYLNFWGNRRNAVVPIQNVIPISEYLDPAMINFYTTKVDLRRYNAIGEPLYMPTFGIQVEDKESFEFVFGVSAFTEKTQPKAQEKNKDQ